jgi:acetyltransferase-like isoleucine patch superfamily enzyme
MNMWKRIKAGFNYRIAKFFHPWSKPRMLQYSKNFQSEKVENLRIGNSTFIDSAQNLILDNNVYIGHHNFIEASNGVTIGKGCQITSFVSISTHSSHISIRLYGSNYGKAKDHVGYLNGAIEIGDFTFVGPHSVIMPNTKIGKGCIVSAFSYVKGEFPDGAVISGNPATIIKNVAEIDEPFLNEHPELRKHYLK